MTIWQAKDRGTVRKAIDRVPPDSFCAPILKAWTTGICMAILNMLHQGRFVCFVKPDVLDELGDAGHGLFWLVCCFLVCSSKTEV